MALSCRGWAVSEEVSSPSLEELELEEGGGPDPPPSPWVPSITPLHHRTLLEFALRDAGEGTPAGAGRGAFRGVWGPSFISTLGSSAYGESQKGSSDQVDSHCSVEAATGRVVETSNHGVQDKGHKLEPRGRGRGVRAGRRHDEGWVMGRGKRSLPELPIPADPLQHPTH